MPLGAKPSDGVFWLIGLNLKTYFPDLRLDLKLDKQIFNWELWKRFNRHKVISWFSLCQCKTQINNSIITIKIKKENAQLAQDVLKTLKYILSQMPRMYPNHIPNYKIAEN
jgi:hypothetical protein